jgi:translation initiation factor eIF-2B subunit alpha
MAVAVAAIRALTSVVKNSSAQTMMGLEKELKDAAASLERCHETAISLKAGCELFLRYTTRTSALEMENFADAKKRIIEVWRPLRVAVKLRVAFCSGGLLVNIV